MTVEKKWGDLQWLWRRDRTLIIPALVFASIPFGGLYFEPLTIREEIAGADVDRTNGIIVISTRFPDCHKSVLAHEWRHHWQWANGIEFDHVAFSPDAPAAEYENQIRNFFGTSKTEMDALLFERKHAPNDVNDHWFGLLAA